MYFMENFDPVDLVCLLGIVPLVVYLFHKRVNLESHYIIPFIYLTAFASVYEIVGTTFFKISAKYWFRFYIFLEFYTILYFYYKLLRYKLFFKGIGFLYLIVYLYLLSTWSSYKVGFLDMPLNVLMTFLVVISSFLWFINVFKKLEDIPLYKRSDFFYISGLLIYFTGTFLVFLMADYLRDNPEYKMLDFWILIVFFNIVLRITLIITIWKARIKSEH